MTKCRAISEYELLLRNNQFRKICALVASAVTLAVLPAAWASPDRQDIGDRLWRDQDNRNKWDDHDSFREVGDRDGDHDRAGRGDRDVGPGRSAILTVPEVVNTAWLLLPLFGAVLVFSVAVSL